MSLSSNPKQNQLLAALPSEEYEQLLPHLELVALDLKKILYNPNESISFVYFILSGVISLLTIMPHGAIVEVATVGNEGFIGLPVFLGATQIPGQALCQVPGTAMRMNAEIFKREVTQGTMLFNMLQRYTQALFNQVAQSAACNRIHTIEERFCRWILMTRDRVPGDTFPLTHEFLGQMLGVRRASVTEVAMRIQHAGLILYKYGKMTVLDREGLESASCECYQIVKREFERLVGGN
ncbi:Crp/Fnr family transcriptional regulator [Candidatus Gracilibacteria bacterium]|nr:Crp/Fnr family transcriptional regulator [Candidatus Gracilibacteria bacterium]NJM86045.1 Crp/Fnr family transcriptional regulator [Hydrococcus sp. RU_2_2]NJP22092.1 Crp/Fnr family transcriptional regulator [Hydrococcus sp. CRU_1_1]